MSPWKRRDFRLIWCGGLVNDTGDWLLMVALPVYVLTTTGSGVTTALLFIAELAPAVLLGSVAGNLVDRWNLRRVVVATNLAQAVALLPLLAVTADRTWPAFVVTVVQGVLARFNNPANAALLVRAVPVDELTAANAARAMSENVARLVGSPLGGILVAVGGLPLVVVVDGVSFLVVAAATAAVRSDARALRRQLSPGDGHHSTAGTRRALGVLRRTRPLPALVSTMTISQVAQGMFVVLFLAFVVRRLGGDGADVGIIRGAQAVGGIAGGTMLAAAASRRSPAALIGIGFGGMAAWGFLTWNLPALTTATVVYAALMALAGPFAVACSVGITTATQRFTPPAYLGLCVGTLEASGALGQAVGAVGAGVLLDRTSLPVLLNSQATIYVLAAAIGFLGARPASRVRRGPGRSLRGTVGPGACSSGVWFMKVASTPHERTIDVDISSSAFWEDNSFDERDETFARLRREAPVSWQPPTEFPFAHDEQGFWAVVRNDDINTVSRQTQRFGSRYGVGLDPLPLDLAKSLSFFLTMDAPEHPRYRELVSSAFTRRQVALIDEQIRGAAREIVDGLVGAGDVDFVEHCASLLPMRTINDMMGVPESERVAAARAGDAVIGRSDPSFGEPSDPLGSVIRARDHLYALGAELAQHRRIHPSDDLLTNLVNAEVDGQRLTDDDIGAFMVLFTVAGNDTTRNTTSLTAVALDRNPDQRAYLMEDFDGRIQAAVEEFVRHASPVQHFTRTALVDTELGGQQIARGDKVGIFYCSGNRDEAVFDRPAEFDVSRLKNPHVGFGGGGPHFCIGAGLARTQLRTVFGELLTRVPGMEVGEPEFAPGNFIRVVERLPAHVP